jgi:hypothetical protein
MKFRIKAFDSEGHIKRASYEYLTNIL